MLCRIFQKQDQGIILNIVEKHDNQDVILHEHSGHGTRSKIPNPSFSSERIPDIDWSGTKDLITVNIDINPKAEIFSNYIQSIHTAQKNINQFSHSRKYQGNLKEIITIKVDKIIDSIFNNNLELGYETEIEYEPSSPKRRKVADNIQSKRINADIVNLLSGGLSPVKELIRKESDVQAILQGLFTGQRYNQYKIKVFSEVSYGHGRADLVLFFVNNEFEETKPIIMELKYISSSQDYNSYLKSKIQLVEYINYLKSSTDHRAVEGVSIIYNSNANNFIQVKTFSAQIDHTSQSSSTGTGKIENIGNYKQEVRKSVIDPILSEDIEYKELDFSNYRLDDNDYIKLISFLQTPNVKVAHLTAINLSNNDINDSKAKLLSDTA